MAIKIYQGVVNQVKDIIPYEFGVVNGSGVIVASSNEGKIGQTVEELKSITVYKQDDVVIEGNTYRTIHVKKKLDGFTYICGTDDLSLNYLGLFTANVINVKSYHDDKYDKYYFVKSILMENILPGDIYLRARELKVDQSVTRVVFFIKTNPKMDKLVFDNVCLQFPDRDNDIVIHIDDGEIVLVKLCKNQNEVNESTMLAKSIIDKLESKNISGCSIGIGTVVESLRELGKSFREAQMALDIGNTFIGTQNVYNYNSLGIGRLIFQMPKTLCRLFLTEVFKDEVFDEIDEETMTTVQVFFENNLNVSETSRQLFVHRNTLVYRLDKIQKLTGLDLRMFDDAITFKVAMLVKKYLNRLER